MTPIDFLPAAKRDLAAIYLFTEKQYGTAQADRYVTEINESCRAVASGHRRSRSEARTKVGLFSHRIKSHRVFHRRRADGGLIVVRILHGRMNWEDHL